MKALVLFGVLFISLSSFSTFDNCNYVDDDRVVNMLDEQFVKDVHSADLQSYLQTLLSDNLDYVTHISGHYAKETDMHYYAVYGVQNGQFTFEMVEVNETLFKSGSYYKTSKSLMSSCRRGNGFPGFPVCQGYCAIRTNGCLGIICPPAECLC